MTITGAGKPMDRLTLPSSLSVTRVTDFQGFMVVCSSRDKTLSKTERTPKVLLDFTNLGTMMLTSQNSPIPSTVSAIVLIQE